MKITILSQQTPHYTGGRYYVYQIAVNLIQLGHEVKLAVDRQSIPFVVDYETQVPVETVNMNSIHSVRRVAKDTDLVIGLPNEGAYLACQYGKQYGCPVWILVLDVPPLLAQYRGSEKRAEVTAEYWKRLQCNIRQADVTTIVLAKYNVAFAREWLGGKHKVTWLYPAVNDQHVRLVDPSQRELWAMWIGRIVPHKRFPHALDAIKPFSLHLNVICARADRGLVSRAGMDGRVRFYVGVSDEFKMKMLGQSMLLLFPSVFEGFGMPLIEAMHSGTPVATYDYPVFREIVDGSNAVVELAELGDREDLSRAIGRALVNGRKREFPVDTRYGMVAQRKRLKQLLERYA